MVFQDYDSGEDDPDERNTKDEYVTGPEGDYENVDTQMGSAVSDGFEPESEPDVNEGLANGRYKAENEDERIQPQAENGPLSGSLMTEERQQRLFNAVEVGYRELRHHRELNYAMVEEYVGPAYVDDGTHPTKYINLMAQAIEAYTMILVGSNPQVYCTAVDPTLKGFATHMNVAMNTLLDNIEIGSVLREWVRNAFFSLGVIKVHMAESGELIAQDDILMDPGTPYASNVNLDDFVFDASARKWSECKFMGDMYRIPFDELQNGAYFEDAVKNLSPSKTLDETGERVEEIGREDNISNTEFDEMIDLCDIYVPRDGLIYTYAVHERQYCTLKGEVLAVQEYSGDATGPYKILALQTVPQKCMPVAPVTQWAPLDRLANNLMRKASNQAKRSKKIIGYTPQGHADAMRVKTAGDGDLVKMTDPNDVVPMTVGGVDPAVNAFMLQAMELFDRMAGNLSAIMGLGASADSVGQEKLINGAVSRMEQSLQQIVNKAANGVVSELGELLFSDEFMEISGEIALPGFPDVTASANWTPEDREGVISDYKVQLDVYSMNYQGPGERIAVMNQLLQTMYTPLMPILQQQGGTIDMQQLTSKYAEMLNQPALHDIVKFTQPEVDPQMQGGEQAGGGGMPQNTNRTYTRRNESAGDRSGVPQQMIPQPEQPKT